MTKHREVKRSEAIDRVHELVKEGGCGAIQEVVGSLARWFPQYSWVGIYVVHEGMLVLGPWTGAQATEHTRIPIGQGICGAAARSGKTEIVEDVRKDPRYLSCFVSTRSEIVVPILLDGVVVGEIDIDSEMLDAFTEEDRLFLEKIAELVAPFIV